MVHVCSPGNSVTLQLRGLKIEADCKLKYKSMKGAALHGALLALSVLACAKILGRSKLYHIYICMYVCIYTHIYIERERQREEEHIISCYILL